MSQFNKEHTAFREDACEEIIDEIQLRFFCLVDKERDDEAVILKYKLKCFNRKRPKKFLICL